MNKLYFVWELLKDNLTNNGDGTFSVCFKNKAMTYFIGEVGDLKKKFPDTEMTYFEIGHPDVFIILMKNESFENKEGAFCREAYNKAIKENADISDFQEYTSFLKSKKEKWECINCLSNFSKFQLGQHSYFCPKCGYFLKDENEIVVRNFGIEQYWNKMVERFINYRDHFVRRKKEEENKNNNEELLNDKELPDKLFKLFVAQFEVYWKSSHNINLNLAESYDRQRAKIHNDIKILIGGDILIVQRAISHVEKIKDKFLHELLDIEDRQKARSKIYDFSHDCVEYILENELEN